MAHELEMINGMAQMFSVVETPWHHLGKIIRTAPTVEEGIKLAGLDWTVSRRNIFHAENMMGESSSLAEVPTHRAIVRDSDQTILGVVGKDYTPLQNSEAFNFFEPFINTGLASLETAGSLRGGSRIWVLAQLNRDPMEIVKGDAVRKFLLLSNGHDGTMAVRVGFTPIRVVCANTLAMSHDGKGSQLLRVFHSSKVAENVEKIRDIVDAANARFEATAEQYRLLASRSLNTKDLREFVKVVFKPSMNEESERAKIMLENLNGSITKLFETGRGTDIPGVRGTAWAAYNAVTEYLSYDRGKLADTRLNNLWFDGGKKLNDLALQTLTNMVA